MSAIQKLPSAVLAHVFSFLPEEEQTVHHAGLCKLFRDATREYMKSTDIQLKAPTEDPVQQKMRARYDAIVRRNPNDKPYMLLCKMHEEQRKLTGPLHFFNIPRGSFGVQRFVEYERVIAHERVQATSALWEAFRDQVALLPDLDIHAIRYWLHNPINASEREKATKLRMNDISLLSPQIGKFTNLHTLMINFPSNMNHEALLPDTFSALKQLRSLSIKGRFLSYPMVITQLPKLWSAHISTQEMDHLPEEAWQHVYTGWIFTALIYAAFSIDALIALFEEEQNRGKPGNPVFTSNFKTYPFGLWFQKRFLLLGNTQLSLATSMPMFFGLGLLVCFFVGVRAVLQEIYELFRHGNIPDWVALPAVCAFSIVAGAASIPCLAASLALNLPIILYNLFMMKAVYPIVALVRDALGYDRMVRSETPR